MNILADPRARLLFRVDPLRHESPRGYLCRVAQEHGYGGPLFLVQIAGLSPPGLEREDGVEQISYLLRLQPEEWRAMCYRHTKGRGRFAQRLFWGERVYADDLNYGRPRLCPECLRERPIWWAIWDLGLVAACPFHRCLLLSACPSCGRRLAWQRPAVHKCRCGLDFRTLTAAPADNDTIAINAVIYRAARFPAGERVQVDLADFGFPPQMFDLRLGSLLSLIRFVGSIRERDELRRRQLPFRRTNQIAATEVGRAAVAVLRDWPSPLRELLRQMVPKDANPAALNFSEVFGNFYRHLFRVLPRSEFGFLHEVFERFVIEDWKGLIRGQHRYFSAAVRRNSQWLPAEQAEKTAHVCAKRIVDLVRHAQIEGILFNARRDQAECWIRRDSLNRWMADRDLELARYMSRPEAARTLGLTNRTIVNVATAGVIGYVKGPEQGFPAGYYFFLREDVLEVKHAFEKHAVLTEAYSKPGEFIALRHGIKNYLGRDSGLSAVIGAVAEGTLVPIGHTTRFPGITGYLFRSEDLRKYRPASTGGRGFRFPKKPR